MQMSPVGRKMLEAREGVRLKAYRDSKDILTVGIGHTTAAGPPVVTPDLVITPEQCDTIFARDIGSFENAVNEAIKIPLTDHEFDALVSLCFNIGQHGFAGSTVVRKLNARDRGGAARAFLLWNEPPEIMGRRNGEMRQFMTPYPPPAGAAS